jgi:PhnB protein
MPLEKQMWGETFGQCADRFGTTWLVNVELGGS